VGTLLAAHFTWVLVTEPRIILNLVPHYRTVIDYVAVLCERPELRRVLLNRAQPRYAQVFLW